jgi:quercetin dioxygenase-like cupin family protein
MTKTTGMDLGKRAYAPSPRPTYEEPAAIPYSSVTRHIWGDAEAGEVADWIYASTGLIHCLVFGVAPGGRFTHSSEFRTVFGADEVLEVLSGTLVIANPETGEVHRAERGERVVFGPNTWHHAFAHGCDPLRVLELFAPPPSTGTSGAYARTQPYLEQSRYARAGHAGDTISIVRAQDIRWRRDLGVLCGAISETSNLAVSTLHVNSGEVGAIHSHPGDEILYVVEGALWVRSWHGGKAYTFELHEQDACFIPAAAEHEYRNIDSETAVATIGVAPPVTGSDTGYTPAADARAVSK